MDPAERVFSLSSTTSLASINLDRQRRLGPVMQEEEERSSVEIMEEEGSEFLHEVSEPLSSGELAFPSKKGPRKPNKR